MTKLKEDCAEKFGIGSRVRMVGSHPHAGESGQVISIDRTVIGIALNVKLDHCPHGTDGCYVFEPKHIEIEKPAISRQRK